MSTGRRARMVRIAGKNVRVGDDRPRRQPMGISPQSSSGLVSASNVAPVDENAQPQTHSAPSLDERIPATPELRTPCSDPEVPGRSIKILREINACLTVALCMLEDACALDIQSSTAFTVDVLKDVLEMIKSHEYGEHHEHEVALGETDIGSESNMH
ncbi:hypothetical protein BKA63DRAFT_227224 [Paraphoma chrysanthemicola]|nr:hypothetical protein BKA63DRAFT_227224 [Paraphoma chrysanthemicola]